MARLGLRFSTIAPNVDETPQSGENPDRLVGRLAEAKARSVAPRHPDALIIGSDQVAVRGSQIVGKPGNHLRAVQQLKLASGKRMDFLTSLCLLNSKTHHVQIDVVTYSVIFRPLSAAQIENYLRREKPYDCAGSFKSEGLGIVLIQNQIGDDPTALIGLPLIRLTEMLSSEGVNVI